MKSAKNIYFRYNAVKSTVCGCGILKNQDFSLIKNLSNMIMVFFKAMKWVGRRPTHPLFKSRYIWVQSTHIYYLYIRLLSAVDKA